MKKTSKLKNSRPPRKKRSRNLEKLSLLRQKNLRNSSMLKKLRLKKSKILKTQGKINYRPLNRPSKPKLLKSKKSLRALNRRRLNKNKK